jgi:hypothetical protein
MEAYHKTFNFNFSKSSYEILNLFFKKIIVLYWYRYRTWPVSEFGTEFSSH